MARRAAPAEALAQLGEPDALGTDQGCPFASTALTARPPAAGLGCTHIGTVETASSFSHCVLPSYGAALRKEAACPRQQSASMCRICIIFMISYLYAR